MKNVLWGAFGLLLFASAAAAQTTQVLTLDEAVAEALANNPRLASANAARGIASAGVREARGAWLPRLDVSHASVRSNNPVFVFGSLLEQGRFGPENFDPRFLNDPPALRNHRLALNARFAVFDQLRRLKGTGIAKNAFSQADSAVEEARQGLRLETIARFYSVTLAEQKRDVAASAVTSGESAAAAIRSKFEQGLLVESDALGAEVQLGSFRQQLIEAEGEIAIARAALNALLGRDVTSEVAVATEMADPKVQEGSLPDALASAESSRGDLHRARLAAENARMHVTVARGTRLPRLDAFGTWGASGESLGDRNSDHAVGLVASFDILDPSRQARIEAARARATAAEADARAAKDRVALEVIAAWNRVRSARARVALAATGAQQASAAARIVGDRYDNGLTTITEQLRAETANVRAQLDYLAARYDLVVGQADLLRATGGLHDVDDF